MIISTLAQGLWFFCNGNPPGTTYIPFLEFQPSAIIFLPETVAKAIQQSFETRIPIEYDKKNIVLINLFSPQMRNNILKDKILQDDIVSAVHEEDTSIWFLGNKKTSCSIATVLREKVNKEQLQFYTPTTKDRLYGIGSYIQRDELSYRLTLLPFREHFVSIN